MVKRYFLVFLGVILLVIALVLAISGTPLAWLVAFLGIGCVAMGIISIIGTSKETDVDDDAEETEGVGPEVRQEKYSSSIEDYRKRVDSCNIR